MGLLLKEVFQMETQNANSLELKSSLNNDDYLMLISDITYNLVQRISKNTFEQGLTIHTNQLSGDLLLDNIPDNVILGESAYGGTLSTNLNTITKNGFYTCAGTATGAPNSSYSWLLIHQNSNVGTEYATQRAVSVNATPIVYERVKVNSTWGDWALQGSGSGGGGVTDFNNLGSISSNQTLDANKITTASFSGTPTITLPTVTDVTKQVTCILDFITTSASYPIINKVKNLTGTIAVTNGNATVTGTGTAFTTELQVGDTIPIASIEYKVSAIASNTSLTLSALYAGTTASGLTVGRKMLRWSKNNQGKPPDNYSILASIRNKIEFRTIWENGLLYWETEYDYYGGVQTTFTFPNLSANNALGGASPAVSAYGEGYAPAWNGVDGSSSTSWGAYPSGNYGPVGWYIWYNPIPFLVTQYNFVNIGVFSTGYNIAGGSFYSSDDGTNWFLETTFTNTISALSALWNVLVESQAQGYHKYRKLITTSTIGGGGYWPMFAECKPVGYIIST